VSEAGAVAWACLTTGFGQWKTGDGGLVAGLDLTACLARPSAAGQDPEILEWLLLAAEPAAVNAINKRVLAARTG
jgi:hypothetical protein